MATPGILAMANRQHSESEPGLSTGSLPIDTNLRDDLRRLTSKWKKMCCMGCTGCLCCASATGAGVTVLATLNPPIAAIIPISSLTSLASLGCTAAPIGPGTCICAELNRKIPEQAKHYLPRIEADDATSYSKVQRQQRLDNLTRLRCLLCIAKYTGLCDDYCDCEFKDQWDDYASLQEQCTREVERLRVIEQHLAQVGPVLNSATMK